MKKKILLFIMSLSLVSTIFIGCGNSDNKNKKEDKVESSNKINDEDNKSENKDLPKPAFKAHIEKDIIKRTLKVKGMHCDKCVHKIADIIANTKGVINYDVSLGNKSVYIEATEKKVINQIINRIKEEGFTVEDSASAKRDTEEKLVAKKIVNETINNIIETKEELNNNTIKNSIKIRIGIKGMMCSGCVSNIRILLSTVRGLDSYKVTIGEAIVESKSKEAIKEAISAIQNSEYSVIYVKPFDENTVNSDIYDDIDNDIDYDYSNIGYYGGFTYNTSYNIDANDKNNDADNESSKDDKELHKIIILKGMMCNGCVKNVTNMLKSVDGITVVNVEINKAEIIAKNNKALHDAVDKIKSSMYTFVNVENTNNPDNNSASNGVDNSNNQDKEQDKNKEKNKDDENSKVNEIVKIKGMMCEGCVEIVKNLIDSVPDIIKREVKLIDKKKKLGMADITAKNKETITKVKEKINNEGYTVVEDN